MKKITEPEEKKQSGDPAILAYDNAVSLIRHVFPDQEYGFNDSCVSSVTYKIENKRIVQCDVTYNKVYIDLKGNITYWPIVEFTVVNPEGSQHNYYDLFKQPEPT
jgi:hypothetical protein